MLEQKLTDFLQYLRFEKRYSQHTLTAYSKDLNQFFTFIAGEFNIDDTGSIAHFHVRSWLASLKDEQQAERSINRKLSSLNSFYKYLMRLQLADKNPVKQLHALRLPKRLPVYLKEQEADVPPA